MGLQQQLEALKAEFTRTAPAGRHALYEAKIDELRRSAAQERTLGVGDADTIADISAWGWLDRASRVRKGAEDPLAPYPNLKRLFAAVDARPAVARADFRNARWSAGNTDLGHPAGAPSPV